MIANQENCADSKNMFGGLLENAFFSKLQRNCLDGFKVRKLKYSLRKRELGSLLDVGCGWGEYSFLRTKDYWGIDNSFDRVVYAQKKYPQYRFFHCQAERLPFKKQSFDSVLLANTAHHLTDEQLCDGLEEIKRVARKYIIIDDCIRSEGQSRLSKFFYDWDRGTRIRKVLEIESIIEKIDGLSLVHRDHFVTFPGLYKHVVLMYQLRT